MKASNDCLQVELSQYVEEIRYKKNMNAYVQFDISEGQTDFIADQINNVGYW